MIYLIGSLKNPRVPEIARALRGCGFDVFDDWHAAGPEADDYWQAYEQQRGRSYQEALAGAHAQDVFQFDHRWLSWSDASVLVSPCGKSGHLELGWALGRKKPGYILLDGEPDRYDVMYNFATAVCASLDELVERLRERI